MVIHREVKAREKVINGWRIVRMDNKGLYEPGDGSGGKRYTYRVYAPGSDNGREEFDTQREAVAFVEGQEARQ